MLGTQFVRSLLINSKPIRELREKTLISLVNGNNVFTVKDNPANSKNPILIVDNSSTQYIKTIRTLSRQELFLIYRIDDTQTYKWLNYQMTLHANDAQGDWAQAIPIFKGIINNFLSVSEKTEYNQWRLRYPEDIRKTLDGMFSNYFNDMTDSPIENWATEYHDFITSSDGQIDNIVRVWIEPYTAEEQANIDPNNDPIKKHVYFKNLTAPALTSSVYKKYEIPSNDLGQASTLIYTSLTGEPVDNYLEIHDELAGGCNLAYKDTLFKGSWVLNIDESKPVIEINELVATSAKFYISWNSSIANSPSYCTINGTKYNNNSQLLFDAGQIFEIDTTGFTSQNPLRLSIELQLPQSAAGCLYKDTLITMADGSLKRIDEIKRGDLVKTPYGIEKVDRVKICTDEITDQYKVYKFKDGKTLKVVHDHRVFDGKKYPRLSECDIPYEVVYEENVVPYNIYTNKSNTYYADGIVCGSYFSNIKPHWFGMFLYKIRRLFISKKPNKKQGKFKKFIYKICLKVGLKLWKY